jgi:hypothetical protein
MKADNHNKIAEAFRKTDQASALRCAIQEIEDTHVPKAEFERFQKQLWYKLKVWAGVVSAVMFLLGFVLASFDVFDKVSSLFKNTP